MEKENIIFITFNHIEADIILGILKSNSIEAFSIDENLCKLDPMVIAAIGGIKIGVPHHQIQQAKAILDSLKMYNESPSKLENQKDKSNCLISTLLLPIFDSSKPNRAGYFFIFHSIVSAGMGAGDFFIGDKVILLDLACIIYSIILALLGIRFIVGPRNTAKKKPD